MRKHGKFKGKRRLVRLRCRIEIFKINWRGRQRSDFSHFYPKNKSESLKLLKALASPEAMKWDQGICN